MFDFIKNLFSGILSFLTGLLGGKKSQKDQPSIKAATPKPSIKAATPKPRKSNSYFMELDETDEKKPVEAKQQANGAAAKTQAPLAPAQPAKPESAKTPEPAREAQPVKIELVQTAKGVKAEPAKPAKALAASANGQNPTETTFAPKYLAPSTSSNGRRRPGPNMNSFLDMARQVRNPG